MAAHKIFAELAAAETTTAGKIGNPAILAWGSAKPADATAGYAPGCIFIATGTGTVDAIWAANIGTATSCNFDLVDLTLL